MKQKELRLAVVLFGGVSLAVYEHGINREILNLVRASRIFHADAVSANGGGTAGRVHGHYPDEPPASTGDVYLEFLEALGRQLSLRVIVDIVAGASAGGINGIALATALAHDLSLAPITKLWLVEADMANLVVSETRARRWGKLYVWPLIVRPLLTRLHREGLLPTRPDAEMIEQVSTVLRSRWFKPPLDGPRMTAIMLDGLAAMHKTATASESLVPTGVRLDLLVTVTDFYGLERPIFLHDPPVARERAHRHLLQFSLERLRTGRLVSDFDEDNLPSLALAGRASSSYPGAFPPMRIREVDDVLAERHAPWPGRSRFLERNFTRYREQGLRPEDAVLVDGSLLDNKPIMACIDAIRSHVAFREVDRRLVFVDPNPRSGAAVTSEVPGFFTTLRGALVDLPRQAPIYNELAAVDRFNIEIRRLKGAITDARPHVARIVEEATAGRLRGHFTVDELRSWRLNSTRYLAGSRIVYDAWLRSLVLEALDFVVTVIVKACRFAPDSQEARRTQEVIEAWARDQGVLTDSYQMPDDIRENREIPAFGQVVLNFGVVYKKRRLHFVLHEINSLYPAARFTQSSGGDSEALDLLKLKIHKCLDDLEVYDDIGFLSLPAVAACRALFLAAPGGRRPNIASGNVASLTAEDFGEITKLLNRLALEGDMARSLDNVDAVLASPLVQDMPEECRRAILTGYLGYFCWDVILRPAASALSLNEGPIESILIDRISPEDAPTLRLEEGGKPLQGGALASFGGFLGRAIRENDYLWGRLHAVDRLLDILVSTVPRNLPLEVDIRALKKRAFQCVLAEEREQLPHCAELIARLENIVERL